MGKLGAVTSLNGTFVQSGLLIENCFSSGKLKTDSGTVLATLSVFTSRYFLALLGVQFQCGGDAVNPVNVIRSNKLLVL